MLLLFLRGAKQLSRSPRPSADQKQLDVLRGPSRIDQVLPVDIPAQANVNEP